jgi:hypothetical protein
MWIEDRILLDAEAKKLRNSLIPGNATAFVENQFAETAFTERRLEPSPSALFLDLSGSI